MLAFLAPVPVPAAHARPARRRPTAVVICRAANRPRPSRPSHPSRLSRQSRTSRARSQKPQGPAPPFVDLSNRERLHKVLSRLGLASLRHAEALISAGRVSVNGRAATSGQPVDIWRDVIHLDGQPVKPPTSSSSSIPSTAVWLALHKPPGYNACLQGPSSIRRFLPDSVSSPALLPVGPIEHVASGLVLLTNERGLVAQLSHPRHPHVKIWTVDCRGAITVPQLDRLSKGVLLNGPNRAPIRADVVVIGTGKSRLSSKEYGIMTRLELRLRDNSHHVVRRLCEAVDLDIVRMIRESFGPVLLGKLPRGQTRKLSQKEIRALKRGVSQQNIRDARPTASSDK